MRSQSESGAVTTHVDSSSTVSFSYRLQSVLRGGLGAIVSGLNWQRVPLAFDDRLTTQSAPGSQKIARPSSIASGVWGSTQWPPLIVSYNKGNPTQELTFLNCRLILTNGN